MGKPRMIILIRHAQSEGNKNREIHQTIPDHRVKLTSEGHRQAQDAGSRLRGLLRPDDKIHFFTSPYRRTRETTEGILSSLTADKPSPSPFPRHTIKVYEEPRLREQDFGNFQPCSAEMERMWLERADYGHFFYRIPNGESAADAYDRVSGFNESMWRLFGEQDFASVCVLVTHGLMTRVFLMKWYHWSVEYFEDLRNINHCEFVIMKLNEDNGKYALQNQLRTWSELKREKELEQQRDHAAKGIEQPTPSPSETPVPIRRKWGGCPDGCTHGVHRKSSLRSSRTHAGDHRKDHDAHHKSTQDGPRNSQISQATSASPNEPNTIDAGETITAPEPSIGDRTDPEMPLKALSSNAQYPSTPEPETSTTHTKKHHHHHHTHHTSKPLKTPLSRNRPNLSTRDSEDHLYPPTPNHHFNLNLIHLVGRDGGGTLSGANSLAPSEDEHDTSHRMEHKHQHHAQHHDLQHETPRAGLKRHKARPSQDLGNDGDDEGSGRQTPKLRRTRSTHHRHVNTSSNLTPGRKSLLQSSRKDAGTIQSIPDTDAESDDASPEQGHSHGGDEAQDQEQGQKNDPDHARATVGESEGRDGDEDGDVDKDEQKNEHERSLEEVRAEDQSIRGSVY